MLAVSKEDIVIRAVLRGDYLKFCQQGKHGYKHVNLWVLNTTAVDNVFIYVQKPL